MGTSMGASGGILTMAGRMAGSGGGGAEGGSGRPMNLPFEGYTHEVTHALQAFALKVQVGIGVGVGVGLSVEKDA